MSNDVAVKDNDFLRQFEIRIDGKLAKIEYSSQEKKIFLTKLVVPENFGEHFKDDFIASVLQLVEQRNLRVVPTSPEIARFLRKHKEYKDLLPVGIRI
ncbi:GNAT family N-acetyltransferase [Sinomicrobium soli]|uniref:GNAT family N-acetyltransferase n=1 Tax=Sinomicrobium sp. N-1-3-6 TaxID=2219864 RepID=UPI000DCF4E8D|nr:GNAT family N-acetyltransferase [Sinomicrobium sp. N-1-3-6]RAV30064.1 N-acetyltransferase [Sinomicrobium sp. N-1-3-6]